jgi:hypothetical protein
MPLPTNDQFSDGMDIFTGRFKAKTDFFTAVDAAKQAFEATDVSYRLHMKKMGENRFLALFLHQVGGPLKTSLSISAISPGSATEAVVHEMKGDNWIKMTSIAERVLTQFGGDFTVRGFRDGEIKVKETVLKSDHSFEESAFIKAVRELSQFADLEQVPGLVRLISDENNRSSLLGAICTHGPALSQENEPSSTLTFG